MCDPVSLIGGALSLAGSAGAASTNAQYTDAVNAQNKKAYMISREARQAEQARQAAMEAEAANKVDTTRDSLSRDNFDAEAAAKSQAFTDTLDARQPVLAAETRLPGQEGATVAVKEAITSRINKEAVATRARVKALADLTSFGRTGETRATNIGQAGDFVSTLGGLRRGSLAVGQQEQDIAPASVSPGNSVLADILKGVGGLATYRGPGIPGQGFHL